MGTKKERIRGQRSIILKEATWKGGTLGMLLFTSSAVWMSIRGYEARALQCFPYLPLIAGIYLIIGAAVMYLYLVPKKERGWYVGVEFMCWLITLFTVFFLLSMFPSTIKEIINVNAAVMLALWLGNYAFLNRIAKELNGQKSMKRRVLLVELSEKPKGKEEFLEELEAYCRKNGKNLEYVERDLPALARLDGVLHKVDMHFYYWYGGPVYMLRLTQLPERENMTQSKDM